MTRNLLFPLAAAALSWMVEATPRPDLVARVASGELKEARASWWGFDATDATAALQAAFDSKVPRLVVDRMPAPWTVLPLKGVSNQEIVLEPGAEIRAKRGAYLRKGDCLLTFRECANVTLTGYGATLGMWHEDYMNPPYEKSEWRHALSFLSCSNVVVRGLTIASSGGDGIYLGVATRRFPKNVDVVIQDVLCHDNHRQGISVISAQNLLIENAVLRETRGTPPAAGIDFEPNHPDEVLTNCVMRNCLTVNNQGAGYTTWAGQMNSGSTPLDIRFESCTSFGDARSFCFACDSRRGRNVGGRVTLRACSFEKARGATAVSLRENHLGGLVYDIADCRIVLTNAAGEEVSVPMDAAWQKARLPLQDVAASIPRPITAVDFSRAEIHDAAPGTAVDLAPLRARHAATYLFYADAARTLHFTGRQCKVGRYPAATRPLTVQDIAGRTLAKIPMPAFTNTAFSFAAPAPGFYRLTVDAGRAAFSLTHADAPVALDLLRTSQTFITSVGSCWFDVPRGTGAFSVFVAGEGSECVKATLVSPQGLPVWEQDAISGWTHAAVRNTPPPGLWRLAMARPSTGAFEDVKVDLVGVSPFLFLSPEKTWTCP